ncbi:GGDEF domain-containing protein, partial [Pseudodesulfovibrio sp.]|uniref:GGDEF domain-containing protein n=1 Tax=Pseudodesulfovibrio sp. TaxID=2035812 RepID=UPI0026045765
LKAVSRAIAATIRPSDLLSRWGGDEFLILLDGKDCEAEILATRIRDAVGKAHDVPVSFSCGIAQYRAGEDIDTLSHRADRAMYKAKKNETQWLAVDKE